MSTLITYRGAVYPWHCDHMGHMNVMWYVGKFDEATWNLFATLGLTPAFFSAQNRGMAAVEQNIVYKRELVAGDVVTIRSTVLEIRETVLRFAHEMVRGEIAAVAGGVPQSGDVAATTILTAVHLDTVARRACAFPADVADRARALLNGGTAQ
jgi:acyl-CoA thioester hydrolase